MTRVREVSEPNQKNKTYYDEMRREPPVSPQEQAYSPGC